MASKPTKARPPKPADRAASPRHKRKKGEARDQARPSLREVTRQIPSEEEIMQIYEEIIHAQDRTIALLLSSQIERYLEWTITLHLEINDKDTVDKLVDRDGPLSSFYGNIWLAYAMGIITDDTKTILNTIRRIRNTFAHAPRPVQFSNPSIAAECLTLKCSEAEKMEESMNRATGLSIAKPDKYRARYVSVCLNMIKRVLLSHQRNSDIVT